MTLCKILNQDFFWKYTNFTFYPRSAKIHNISKIIHHKKKKRKNLIYDKNLENKIRQKSFVLQLPLTNSFQNSPTIISSPFNRSITFPLNYSSFQAWNDSREKKRREKKKEREETTYRTRFYQFCTRYRTSPYTPYTTLILTANFNICSRLLSGESTRVILTKPMPVQPCTVTP